MNNQIAHLDESAVGWQRSLYAFLAEKQRRSGSDRTVQSYSRMLRTFSALRVRLRTGSPRRTYSRGPTALACQAKHQVQSPSAPASLA